jgi:hypothetical protein
MMDAAEAGTSSRLVAIQVQYFHHYILKSLEGISGWQLAAALVLILVIYDQGMSQSPFEVSL